MRAIAIGSAILLAATAPCGTRAAELRLVEQAGLEIEVRPMLVVDGQSGSLPAKRFTVDPDKGGRLEIRLQWPRPTDESRLRLEATGRPGPVDGEHRVRLEARLVLPDGTGPKAQRDLALREGAASLVEVYRQGAERLTLAVTATRKVLRLAPPQPRTDQPVVFKLQVAGVRGERVVELETNYMSTFMGEPVEYSFQRGAGDGEESVRLLLTPIRSRGEVVEISISVSGSLPGSPSRLLLGRSETLFTSRGATSGLTVTTGEPPSGYTFRITPEF